MSAIREYRMMIFFFFNDTATTEIYTLSLHDALPILVLHTGVASLEDHEPPYEEFYRVPPGTASLVNSAHTSGRRVRSEEHTSELQSRQYLVCRLLLEKKKSF